MGIEFISRFQQEVSQTTSEQLLQECLTYEQWQIISQNLGDASFQLKGSPTRESWNEDGEIVVSTKELYVLFHSASGEQRENCISYLNNCLKKFNLFSELEEP
jgi:hypothetical protein